MADNSAASDCSFSAISRHTFRGWIESHNPDFKWNWSDPKSVIEEFTHCVSSGTTRGFSIDLEPVFGLFFSQGYSGLEGPYGGPETIWLDYLRINSEACCAEKID